MLFAVPAVPALAQPNDSFDSATAVDAIPFGDSVDVSDATVEPGEPVEVCAPMANTMWYSLTLDRAATVLIDTAGSTFDTVLAVWQGDAFSDLELVKCVDDTPMGLQSRIVLSADAGVTYLIQAGSFGEAVDGALLELSIDRASRNTGQPIMYRGSSRGNAASAYLDEFDDDSYTSTSVYLFAGRAKYAKGKPYTSSEVSVSRSSSSFSSDGSVTWEWWYGSTTLPQGTSQLDSRLRNARVFAEVTVFGTRCEQPPYEESEDGYSYSGVCTELVEDVVVDLTWVGQGSTYRYSYTDRSSSANGYRGNYSSSSTARDADVTGEIASDANGWNVSMNDAFGTLQRDSSRFMTVYRGIFAY